MAMSVNFEKSFFGDALQAVLGNIEKSEMFRKQGTDSLMTMTIRTIVKNLGLYFDNGYTDFVNVLPNHLKTRMLKLVTVSPYFWKGMDLNTILRILCNRNVQHINLTTWMPNDETLEILKVCRSLEDLHLTYNEASVALTTKGLTNLFPNLTNLRLIRLTSCQQANDDVVESIAANCKKLTTLDLGGCSHITDRSLEALGRLEHLESLRVYKTQITEHGLEALVSGPCGPKLTELRVDDCDNLNQRVLITITKKCPNLEILTFHKRLSPENNYFPDDLDMTQLKQVMYSISL